MRPQPARAISYRGKTTASGVAKHGVGHRTRQSSDRHIDWRTRCLLDAGFDARDAVRLGRDSAYDLHALLELIDRGCPPSLATRILAPLDAAPWE
jgi:hypothetical protein